MFNILVIVALSAAAAEGTLTIDWRPVYRDVFFYGLSVTLFMIFASDSKVVWYEALIMVLCYFLYILIMKFNKQLFEQCDRAAEAMGMENGAQVPYTKNGAAVVQNSNLNAANNDLEAQGAAVSSDVGGVVGISMTKKPALAIEPATNPMYSPDK
jgi:Ca2+/Na+ antiporter